MKYLKRIKGGCTECCFFEQPNGAMAGACIDWPGKNDCLNDPLNDYCFRLATTSEIAAYKRKRRFNCENLEWLVYHCLNNENPCISIGRGKELLGFKTMNEMHDWIKQYTAKRYE